MLELFDKIKTHARGKLYRLIGVFGFKRVGINFKILGCKYISVVDCCVGDNCWFQAISLYKGDSYLPLIKIGQGTMFSSNVHISAVKNITIGVNCLFGSNIYIGDHSHGSTALGKFDPNCPPALRRLGDIADVVLGENIWVGDGVVILAGSEIGSGCVIGANSVVKGKFPKNCLVAGIPAKVIRVLSDE